MNHLQRKVPATALAVLTAVSLGAAVVATVPTALADPATAGDSSVVINEVQSSGTDWVELANTDPNNSVDISGWGIIDDDPSHTPVTFPEGTEIESGGYISIETEPNFGLGKKDSVTLTDAGGTGVDETSWSGHADNSWGRVPDMEGEFAGTGEATRDAKNVAEGDVPDGPDTPADAWPFDPQDIGQVTLTDDHDGDFVDDFAGEDMSGVDFGPDGRAYVVNNDVGTLYVLTPQDGNSYHIDSRHQLRYPSGLGEPDAEGVTVGHDGALYVSTERNNWALTKNTSRPSVLRFDLSDSGSAGSDGSDEGELTATDEWNLAGFTGEIGANGGLESIAWISDADRPALYAVGVEDTGEVLFVDLSGEDAELVQRYDSPFEGVMASDYDAATGELTILCDEACDGASQILVEGDDGFGPVDDSIQARPEGMDNLANEGYARYVGPDGAQRFLWADDGVTDGVGLRGAVVPADGGSGAGDEPGDQPTGSSVSVGSLGTLSSSVS